MTKNENEHLNDASIFLQQVSGEISENLKYEDLIINSIIFALGIERILKGILFDINPIYIFKSQDFKNTASIIYKEKLLPGASKNQEILSNPDEDVLSLRQSILRAKCFSKVTNKYTGFLFALSNVRDIIAHCNLSLLNKNELELMLLRDYYPLIRDYCDELGIPLTKFLGSNEIKITSLSARYQESIEDRLKIKFESHRKRWNELSNVPGFFDAMDKITTNISENENVERYECPACRNESLIFYEPDYDFDFTGVNIIGIFVNKLICRFCKLEIDDYQEIDYLELNKYMNTSPWEDEF